MDSKIEKWDIHALIPYELNAKKHDKAQVKAIAASIQRFGFDQPIVVDQFGVIIKGHGRRLACLELGMTEVLVLVRYDLTPDQVKAARLADNRVAIGDLDTQKLTADLAEFNTELLGGIFDAKELDFGTADLGAIDTSAFMEDMDDVLQEQEAELTKRTAAAAEARVTLARAFGFKDVPTDTARGIAKMLAIAEKTTGETGAAAFSKWVQELTEKETA
ncbi:hypothetical protein ATN89_17550 [Comamonas thiooxydans]|uniref:ParB/Srx family N-terminal domain-containing protein n=1 Tax=Comamonas thiooxydans TaxID=363952 RepID=UPI0007C4FAA8|nr:ParB/Srx family N-terminal domain-containing protein [Comamonas thiooxydans]OAD82887.1 hypothetical protein ATN89_17550 [Comamonas thiooxydans]